MEQQNQFFFMKKFGFLKGSGFPLINFGLDVAMGEDVDKAAAGSAGFWGGASMGAAMMAPVPVPGARIVGGIVGGLLGESGMKQFYSSIKKTITGGLTKDKSNNNTVEAAA